MGVFDRFRRNRQESVLPEEVKQYYQSENRQRRGVAVLMAFIALVATVAIAAGLFFGGRYAYNKIQGNDSSTAQQNGENKGQTDDFGGTGDQNSGQPGSNAGETPEPTTEAPGQPATPPASTPSNPETQTPAPAPQATPPLGDSPLPRTGDEGM